MEAGAARSERKGWWGWGRLLAVPLLLALLATRTDLRGVLDRLTGVAPWRLALLLAVNTLVYVLFATRWRIYCRRLALPHAWTRCLRGVYVFQLTSQVVPSPLLGEAGRFLVFPRGTSKADILKSIALDRLANQIALAALVLTLLPWYRDQGLSGGLLLLLAVPAGAVALAFLVGRRLFATNAEGRVVARLAFLRLLGEQRLTLGPFLLGVGLALLTGLEFQWAAAALPLSVEPPQTLFLFVPALSLALSLAPVSFGDWGTRELFALYLLEA